jgi:uncharacterized membrane protein
MHYEVAVEIAAPADKIWTVLRDVEHWSDWSPTIDEITRPDDKPFDVGSKALVKQPKMQPLTWEVTELDEGRSFVWKTTMMGVSMVAGHYIEDANGGSSVRLTLDMTGGLAPLFNALGGKRARHYVDLEGSSLKAWCEKQPVA